MLSFGIIGGGAVLFTASAVTGTGILPLLGGLSQIMAHFNHRPSFYDGSITQALGQLGQFWVEERLCQELCAHRHSAGGDAFQDNIYRSSVTPFRFNDTMSSITKPGQDPASAVYSLKQEEEHPAQDHARGLICPRLPKGGQKSDLVVRLYHEEYLKIHCIMRV